MSRAGAARSRSTAIHHLIHPPIHLPAWPEGPRMSRLVFIAQGLRLSASSARCATSSRACGAARTQSSCSNGRQPCAAALDAQLRFLMRQGHRFLDRNVLWVWNLLIGEPTATRRPGRLPVRRILPALHTGGRYDLESLASDVARAALARRLGAGACRCRSRPPPRRRPSPASPGSWELTGPLAHTGAAIKMGIEAAVDEINESRRRARPEAARDRL